MIQINKVSGVEYMPIDEFARWACLIEAFDFIFQRAEEKGVESFDFMKPAAFDTYIAERFPAMSHDIMIEHRLGNI